MNNIDGVLTPKQNLTGTVEGVSNIDGNVSIPINAGTSDYNKLKNLPSVENIELRGNKTFSELGLEEVTNQDILDMFK